MEQSLIAAVSGIEANQTYLDVIGNNIANSDTTGYKAEDPVFTDLLAEQIAGASAPARASRPVSTPSPSVPASGSGRSPTTSPRAPSSRPTSPPTSPSRGRASWWPAQTGQQFYTRAGNLTLDANGDLATPTGALIQGWQATGQGVIDTNAPVGVGQHPHRPGHERRRPPAPSPWAGTSRPGAAAGTPPVVTTTLNGFDSLGNTIPLTLTFTPWRARPTPGPSRARCPTARARTNLWTHGTDHHLQPHHGPDRLHHRRHRQLRRLLHAAGGHHAAGLRSRPATPGTSTSRRRGRSTAVTQFGGEQTAQLANQNGNSAGTLESYTDRRRRHHQRRLLQRPHRAHRPAGPGQLLQPHRSHRRRQPHVLGLGQLGPALPSARPGTGGRGTLLGGALEGSNVDLATQLTDMIEAQEAYQADTKVVSTTSTALQSLVQMQ